MLKCENVKRGHVKHDVDMGRHGMDTGWGVTGKIGNGKGDIYDVDPCRCSVFIGKVGTGIIWRREHFG